MFIITLKKLILIAAIIKIIKLTCSIIKQDAFAQDVMARLNIDITNYRSHATFYRLAFMYLLTYIPPFSKEVRNTKNGWISPEVWAIVKIHKTELQNLIIECEKVAKISFNN